MLDPLFLIPTKGAAVPGGVGRAGTCSGRWCGMQLVWMQSVWDAAGAGCSGCGMELVRDAVVEHHYTASLTENETPSFMSGRSWSIRGLREL